MYDGAIYWTSTEKVQVGSEACFAYGIYVSNGNMYTFPVYEQQRVRAMKWF